MNERANQVLVVDDDFAMCCQLSKWLQAEGYVVHTAANGRQAIEAIEQRCPHVLITDWEMPCVDGLELCRHIRNQPQPHYVYTILFTVRSNSADIVRGLEAGADDFCKKPIDRDELLARMRSGARVIDLERRMRELAQTDALTGLFARRAFLELCGKQLSRAQRQASAISCVIVDIDHFKQINDQNGQQSGDNILRSVAEMLRNKSRDGDLISRYDGEQFCVLLADVGEAGAVAWAERARALIRGLRIPLPSGKQIPISASFGVASLREDTRTLEQLIDMADQALLVAKQSGRDKVVSFQSLSHQAVTARERKPAEILRQVSARTIMNDKVASLSKNDTLGEASQLFLRMRTNSASVVNEDGRLVGVISEKDVMTTMLRPDWYTMTVQDVMKTNVVAYEEETPAATIYDFLCRVTIRGVVIVKEGRPTGMINRGTLLRFFTNAVAVQKRGGASVEAEAAVRAIAALADSTTPQERVSQVVRSLASESADLARRVHQPDCDVIPCVVGGATRIQELVNDLLSYCRFANEGAEEELPLPAVPMSQHDSSETDTAPPTEDDLITMLA